ncbi:MAG: NAD+ synthase [Bacteroidota bacterium]
MEGLKGQGPETLLINTRLVKELLVRFLRDECTNAGFTKGIVGVSGGVDSAVSAALTAEGLGRENTLAVVMPHRSGSPHSVQDAEEVARTFGLRTETVDITPMVDAYCNEHRVSDKVRRGNVMARMRMIVLYDISARERALVVGTSNKTEILLGYGTLFGDLACALNPLGDLYKTQVWQLAEFLGIPKRVIEKPPTADLWEGQTDEAELGLTYREADRVLVEMVDERRKPEELVAMGFPADLVHRIGELIRKSQYKRRPPLIAKISKRTVNVDFRYVRDWGI